MYQTWVVNDREKFLQSDEAMFTVFELKCDESAHRLPNVTQNRDCVHKSWTLKDRKLCLWVDSQAVAKTFSS